MLDKAKELLETKTGSLIAFVVGVALTAVTGIGEFAEYGDKVDPDKDRLAEICKDYNPEKE